MKLLGSTETKIAKDKEGEIFPYLESIEVVLIHSNVVNNSYLLNSRLVHTFVLNNSSSQLLNISPENFIFLKTFDLEFSYIEVWFTDQNSNPLEIEEKINTTLVINLSIRYKKWHAVQFNQENICKRLWKNDTLFSSIKRIFAKDYNFCLLLNMCVKMLVKIKVKA